VLWADECYTELHYRIINIYKNKNYWPLVSCLSSLISIYRAVGTSLYPAPYKTLPTTLNIYAEIENR
jgi:hypothetical protein